MNKYEIKGPNHTVHAWYRAGLLVKMQVMKGKLTAKAMEIFKTWMPLQESTIPDFNEHWPDLAYTQIMGKPPTIYTQLMREWFNFYERLNGIRPKISGTDGKALKQIEGYLMEASGDDMEALATWQHILGQWHTLPEWYQKKTDLPFINSKLNELLTQLKHGQSTRKTKAKADADDLRGSL